MKMENFKIKLSEAKTLNPKVAPLLWFDSCLFQSSVSYNIIYLGLFHSYIIVMSDWKKHFSFYVFSCNLIVPCYAYCNESFLESGCNVKSYNQFLNKHCH